LPTGELNGYQAHNRNDVKVNQEFFQIAVKISHSTGWWEMASAKDWAFGKTQLFK